MSKIEEFNEALAKVFANPTPRDSWIADYLHQPYSAFEGVTVTTAIPPGEALSFPWAAIEQAAYSELQIDCIHSFTGSKIVESLHAVERYEDWSAVRSLARAARRRKRGFRQNVIERERPCAFEIGGVLYMHPELMKKLSSSAEAVRTDMDKRVLNSLFGRTM